VQKRLENFVTFASVNHEDFKPSTKNSRGKMKDYHAPVIISLHDWNDQNDRKGQDRSAEG
jgi:hypothetical protein